MCRNAFENRNVRCDDSKVVLLVTEERDLRKMFKDIEIKSSIVKRKFTELSYLSRVRLATANRTLYVAQHTCAKFRVSTS